MTSVMKKSTSVAGMAAAMPLSRNTNASRRKVPLPSGILQKTISIGVAEFPADADSFWQVVKYADVALYKAKAAGRNRVVRFLPEMWDSAGSY